MAQVNSHPSEQVMRGLCPKRVSDMVLDAMTDHEKLSMNIQRQLSCPVQRQLSWPVALTH